MLSSSSTTGPPENDGGGGDAFQELPAGNTSAASQTIKSSASTRSRSSGRTQVGSARASETRYADSARSGSQYCIARESEMRDNVFVVGGAISVLITGSQTTRTRTGWLLELTISSTAEAPRRHTGQVGESKSSSRVRSDAALKACADR